MTQGIMNKSRAQNISQSPSTKIYVIFFFFFYLRYRITLLYLMVWYFVLSHKLVYKQYICNMTWTWSLTSPWLNKSTCLGWHQITSCKGEGKSTNLDTMTWPMRTPWNTHHKETRCIPGCLTKWMVFKKDFNHRIWVLRLEKEGKLNIITME